jgi:hypothetical protein
MTDDVITGQEGRNSLLCRSYMELRPEIAKLLTLYVRGVWGNTPMFTLCRLANGVAVFAILRRRGRSQTLYSYATAMGGVLTLNAPRWKTMRKNVV